MHKINQQDNTIVLSQVDLNLLQKIAAKIAALVTVGDVITLEGELGAGKTAFAKFFINSLVEQELEVVSPTFTLLQTYKAKNFAIWHFDLYRLEFKEEAYELGIEDAFLNAVSLIEWAEVIKDLLPEDKINIKLEIVNEEGIRSLSITPYGSWNRRLNSFFF